jgi:F0F1-type ATP synthase membrane subunit a
MIIAEAIAGTHPTIQVCGNAFLCTFNYDTLISSGIAIVLTLGLGFGVAYSLGHGKPRRLQMVLELLLGYIRNLTGEMVSDEAAGFVVPIAATIFIFVLLANWLDAFPIAQPVEPAAADINLTLAMALAVIVIVQWYSIHVLGFPGYLRRFTKPFELTLVASVLFTPHPLCAVSVRDHFSARLDVLRRLRHRQHPAVHHHAIDHHLFRHGP